MSSANQENNYRRHGGESFRVPARRAGKSPAARPAGQPRALSASIAHEIKNGLVAINTFVELLLEKDEDREMAEMVRRELKRIDGLVTQMLRLSAPKPAALATVHVHDLLDHSLRLLEHQMSGRMISLKRDYRAAPDTVRGDESQLQQAFMNLLLNGVEAMGSERRTDRQHGNRCDGGTLEDFTSATPARASRRKIWRGCSSRSSPPRKTAPGLGLAICRRIVQEHHGTIEVAERSRQGLDLQHPLPLRARTLYVFAA